MTIFQYITVKSIDLLKNQKKIQKRSHKILQSVQFCMTMSMIIIGLLVQQRPLIGLIQFNQKHTISCYDLQSSCKQQQCQISPVLCHAFVQKVQFKHMKYNQGQRSTNYVKGQRSKEVLNTQKNQKMIEASRMIKIEGQQRHQVNKKMKVHRGINYTKDWRSTL